MPVTNEEQLSAFLRELTELSIKHKIGIAVPVELFIMENDDLDLTYSCDADSMLTY